MNSKNSLDRRWSMAIDALRKGDKAGSLHIFKSLAKEGEPAAYREIANIYEFGGGGVEKNIQKAIQWYEKSVDEVNDGYGCIGLARVYFYGKEGEPNYSKALEYLSLIENNNLPLADLMLGRMYRLGKGTDSDYDKAKIYYRKSAASGNLFAIKELGKLEMESGQFIYGIYLWMKALAMTIIIGAKDIYDHRLKNL